MLFLVNFFIYLFNLDFLKINSSKRALYNKFAKNSINYPINEKGILFMIGMKFPNSTFYSKLK